MLHRVKDSNQIGADHTINRAGVDLGEFTEWMDDPCVVYCNVELAETADSGLSKLLYQGLISDIAGLGHSFCAKRLDSCGSLRKLIFENIGEHKAGAFGSEPLRGETSKTPACPGYKNACAFVPPFAHRSLLDKVLKDASGLIGLAK
jgi:hypothetical protein